MLSIWFWIIYCCISTPPLTVTLEQAWYEWHLTCRVSRRSAANCRGNVREFHVVWRVVTLNGLKRLVNGQFKKAVNEKKWGITMFECWWCCVISNDGGDGQSASREPNMPTALQLQHQQFLGDVSSVLLDLGTVQVDDNELLPEGITVEHLSTFELMYVAHCEVNLYRFLWFNY